MTEIHVTLPADVQQVDETGFVWTFLDEAAEPERVMPGRLIIAGDTDEPFLARVVDIVERGGVTIVHLEVLAHPDDVVDELRHANVLAR